MITATMIRGRLSTARRLNGDERMSGRQRTTYLITNALRNLRPYHALDAALTVSDFQCDVARVRELAGSPSPSRALSDLFWMHVPWSTLVDELGPLHVADLGCGKGLYGLRFAKWSGGRVSRYHGVDWTPRPEWRSLAAEHPFLSFQAGDVREVDRLLPDGTNLIVSQSAMEHVADDLECFDRLHAYAHASRRPLVQIHLVPSQACLWLYLWHGFRQYTPRVLSVITGRYDDCTRRLIVRLGGATCNALHWRAITWPRLVLRRCEDRRASAPERYHVELEQAISRDLRRPQRSPAFYALILHSNRARRGVESDGWPIVPSAR